MWTMNVLEMSLLSALMMGALFSVASWKQWRVVWKKSSAVRSSAGLDGKSTGDEISPRDLLQPIEDVEKRCIIFYGSETGTAEAYAKRIAIEGKTRFGLESMVADLGNYDFENLDQVPPEKIIMFVLATAGEGEPTSNAAEFYKALTSPDATFSEGNEPKLANLRYVIFGLGNHTYEHYNRVARCVDASLLRLSARRIGTRGEGDDGAGTLEEDFVEWKETMWTSLALEMNLQRWDSSTYQPAFQLVAQENVPMDSSNVYMGELNEEHLRGTIKSPATLHNPHIAAISHARELFKTADRNCIHLDVDISSSGSRYQTGDHIAIWPTNSDKEVDAFLEILGLKGKRYEVIGTASGANAEDAPFPTPTTYDTIVRYYMEICEPVSRENLTRLAQFAPNHAAKKYMTSLGNDQRYFKEAVTLKRLNIATVLREASSGRPWIHLPFSAVVQGMKKLMPRYYSISSSAIESPHNVSVTVVVESSAISSREDRFYGVASNFLLAIQRQQAGGPSGSAPSYNVVGPRNKYEGTKIPFYIRESSFRLPADKTRPVIMVGPGTGVAPFRGFVREYAKTAQSGTPVGKMILFYGCRKQNEDFIYEEEWKVNRNGVRLTDTTPADKSQGYSRNTQRQG